MNLLTHFSAFALGFSCALLIICRVTMRPKATRVLKKIGLVKLHKAKVPKIEIERDEIVVFDE